MTLPDEIAERIAVALERLEQRLGEPTSPLPSSRRLATTEEAMERLGVRRTRLFQLMAQGKLIRVLEGLRARIDLQSLEAYEAEVIREASGIKRRGPGRPRKTDAQREAEKIAKLKP